MLTVCVIIPFIGVAACSNTPDVSGDFNIDNESEISKKKVFASAMRIFHPLVKAFA